MRQMSDGGGDDIPAPTVLDGHRDTERNAQIADLPGFTDTAHLGDFQIDHIHGPVVVCS